MSGWNPPRGYKDGHGQRGQWGGQGQRTHPPGWTWPSNGSRSGWARDMSHDEAQSYSRRNESGEWSHRNNDTAASRLLEMLREREPYLRLRLKQIIEQNRLREFKKEVDDIDWIFRVMSGVNVDLTRGTRTLQIAFGKVLKLERLHPIPTVFAGHEVSNEEEEEKEEAGQANIGPPPATASFDVASRSRSMDVYGQGRGHVGGTGPQGYPSQEIPGRHQFNDGMDFSEDGPYLYDGVRQGQGHQASFQYDPAPTQPTKPLPVPESRPLTVPNFESHRRQDLPPKQYLVPRSMGPSPLSPGSRSGPTPWFRPPAPRPPHLGIPDVVKLPPPPIIPTQRPSSLTTPNHILEEPPKKGTFEATRVSRGQGHDLSTVIERVKQKVAMKVVPRSMVIHIIKTVEHDDPCVTIRKTSLSLDKEVDDGQRPGPSLASQPPSPPEVVNQPPSPPEVVNQLPSPPEVVNQPRGRGRPRGKGKGKGSQVGQKVPPCQRSSKSESESDVLVLPTSTVSSPTTESVVESSTLGMNEAVERIQGSVSPLTATAALLEDPGEIFNMCEGRLTRLGKCKLLGMEICPTPGSSTPKGTSVPTAEKKQRKPRQSTTSREKMIRISSTLFPAIMKGRQEKSKGKKTTKKKSKKNEKTKPKVNLDEDIWKERGFIGPRDIEVNLGWTKIKMESDYVLPPQNLVENEVGHGQDGGQDDEMNDNDGESPTRIKVEELDVSDYEFDMEEGTGEILGKL